MKIPSSHRASGFTLVELLVVILIIAALAALGFAAGNSAIQKAKKVTALASASAIETAVNNFFTEYGSMPATGTADATEETDSSGGTKLLNVLLGAEGTSGTPLNTRGVKFLSVREGKKKGSKGVNGMIYDTDGKSAVGLYDPWGGNFKIRMDLDYDEQVTVRPKGGVSKTLNRRVAAWSDGADGVSTTGKSSDDVITW